MSETSMPSTSCTQNLLLTSLYTLNLLFLHIPECKLLITKFLNALFILDTASLEPSEVEVRSISLIISKTHFFHCCSLFYLEFYIYSILFRKLRLQKLSLPVVSIISKTKLTFSYFSSKFKGSMILNHPIQLHCRVFEEQPKIFLHAC